MSCDGIQQPGNKTCGRSVGFETAQKMLKDGEDCGVYRTFYGGSEKTCRAGIEAKDSGGLRFTGMKE